MEIVLRLNFGPLQLLDGLIEEVFQREKKNYVRKTERIDKIVTKDLSKSAAVASFQKKSEEKSSFPASFWQN